MRIKIRDLINRNLIGCQPFNRFTDHHGTVVVANEVKTDTRLSQLQGCQDGHDRIARALSPACRNLIGFCRPVIKNDDFRAGLVLIQLKTSYRSLATHLCVDQVAAGALVYGVG